MPDMLAAKLNGDCHAAILDRAALQHAMQAQGEAWHSLVTERCPHLFADAAVFISSAQLQQMLEVIAAVERVVELPGWHVERDALSASNKISIKPVIPAQAGIQSKNHAFVEILDSGLRRNDENNKAQHSTKGVFFGYDFHLNAQGAHLIEINSNAGGGFLNSLLLDSQRDVGLPGVSPICASTGSARTEINLEQIFLDMFRNEWRLERGDAPLNTVAIVDERPEEQYLYPEFLLTQKMFERAGISAHIVDPSALQAHDDGLYLGEQKIELIYSRLTDFDLQQYPHIRSAWERQQVALTPNPAHYVRYSDKRNLARLTDAQGLRAFGASEADISTLQAGIPHTVVVQPDMEAALWAERKQWFFKPVSGYGGKGAYRGDKLTKRVFEEIMRSDYVAQRLALPGERQVCMESAEPQSLKYDVRCYVYEGQVQLVAARLYQGQTTNFRTPGGGFALVRVVE